MDVLTVILILGPIQMEVGLQYREQMHVLQRGAIPHWIGMVVSTKMAMDNRI